VLTTINNKQIRKNLYFIYDSYFNFLQCICAKKLWKLAGSRQSYCKN